MSDLLRMSVSAEEMRSLLAELGWQLGPNVPLPRYVRESAARVFVSFDGIVWQYVGNRAPTVTTAIGA